MTSVEDANCEILVVTVAEQGPPGTGGGSMQVTHPAGEDLVEGRLVYLDDAGEAFYADNDLEVSCQTLLGVTTQDATMGDDVIIQTYGEMTVPGWAWSLVSTPELFLDADGNIVQGLPLAGIYAQKIGFVISATTAFIRILGYDTFTPVGDNDVLLEDGFSLLLEDGSFMLLE